MTCPDCKAEDYLSFQIEPCAWCGFIKKADQELPQISYSRELLVHKLASKMVSWGLALAEDHQESFSEEEEYEHMEKEEWFELVDEAINEALSWIPENPGSEVSE